MVGSLYDRRKLTTSGNRGKSTVKRPDAGGAFKDRDTGEKHGSCS